MKVSKSLLKSILVGITISSSSCYANIESTETIEKNDREEAEITQEIPDSLQENCPVEKKIQCLFCGMG